MKILQLKTGLLIFFIWICIFQLSGQVVVGNSSGRLETNDLAKMAFRDATSVKWWWWGWLGGYSAATIGQGIAGINADKLTFRQDMFLSAATTFLGAAGQLISPVQPVNFREWRDLENAGVSDQTRRDEYLRYLEKMAVAEKKGRGWQMHLASGTVNLTCGLVTWLGFKRTWKDGLMNFAINTVVTEAQIWSQPMKARKYLSKYNNKSDVSEYFQNRRNPDYFLSVGSNTNRVWLKFMF